MDGCQFAAEKESTVFNAGKAAGHTDVGEAAAAVEQICGDGIETGGERNAGQIVTSLECLRANVGYSGGDRDIGQIDADRKGDIPNAGYTGGYDNTCWSRIFVERPDPDRGNRETINDRWNGNDRARSGVSCDSDAAIVG